MPLSNIKTHTVDTDGALVHGPAGNLQTIALQNLSEDTVLRYWFLSRTEQKAGKPTSLTADFKEIGPGQERTWSGQDCPENGIFVAAKADSVLAAVETKRTSS